MRWPVGLPAAVRNPVSLLGVAGATATAVTFLGLLLLELLGYLTNPYAGLLVFVTVPLLFILALLLIPAGAWWASKRRRQRPDAAEWPVIDLGVPRQRTIAAAVVALTLVNIVIVSLAAYGSVHYMESSAFCGTVCHTTMEPQFVAAQVWPHAKVACAQCHIGPGAGAAVEAKLAGTRQLYHVLTGQVPRPVPSPQRLISSSRDTCEGCHWPAQVHGDRLKIIREYANDEGSSESVTTLTLHVGGASPRLGTGTGIHWHMNPDNRIEYVAIGANDSTIPYVRLTDRRGQVREYLAEGTTIEQVAGAPRRRMECTDCHSRPAHTFFFTPGRAIDTAIAEGRLPRDLPFARREAVAAVSATYSSRAAALEGIERALVDFYRPRAADPQHVSRMVAGARDVWQRNVFPAMNVTWGTYPNDLGHVDAPGCFRCHDDTHKTRDGTVIRQDCSLCHATPE